MNETSHALNEIEILTRDRDEWKRRALAAEEMLAELQAPQILHITCSECDEELSVGITVTPSVAVKL